MTAILKVDGISLRFGGLQALNEVSVELAPAEVLGLIGPNGAGKTTLLNVIAGTYQPTAGFVHFLEQDVTSLAPHRRCRLGIVKTFQVTRPFLHLTVEENVATGAFLRHHRRADAAQQARRWMEFVGLGGRSRQSAGVLSTADRKRLEVARALATEPKLLLLDEVFSGLNAAEIEESLEWARRIPALGIAVIVTEHLLRPITALAQRTLVLDQGRNICDALTQVALTDPAVMEAYFGAGEQARA